ncbi:hypothetical protein [Psychrobacter sp. 16-MNA-CIBAN-0192]|uniref:hypothetical protein n=1 Tax=Psychrobacter sp. 16-MNA-CIBAN-0192 TaxID=3140448 RepID=UPI00332F9361
MFTNHFLTSWRSYCSLAALSMTMALTGCTNMPNIDAPDTTPIQTPAHPQASDNRVFSKCPPYNPEQNICTAQYDPVCVTVKNGSTISYRTAGNACSACGSALAVGYVKGECQ